MGTVRGWCLAHAPARQQSPDTRLGAGRRGYGRKWDTMRAQWLAAHPLCRCGAPAVLVHHIRPISAGGAALDPANLISLCRACHGVAHKELGP
jgi:5-methylcytosine-specific restriction endonuclease McrA